MFKVSFLAVMSALAAFPLLNAAEYKFKIPEAKIHNQHYHAPLMAILGRNSVSYHLSGQQEPDTDEAKGAYYLIMTPTGDAKPTHWINLKEILSMDQLLSIQVQPGNLGENMSPVAVPLGRYYFGGTLYNVRYTPNSIFTPRKGFVYYEPQEQGLKTVKVSSVALLKSLHDMCQTLSPLPLKVAQYTKKNDPQGTWIILTNIIEEDRIGDFDSFLVDASNLPISRVSSPAPPFHMVNFNNYELALAYIEDTSGRFLFIRARPE
ncbi:MAG: hypothetical protein HY547_03410 [Elusimicrobia bacterium]|nr:hypothetical protein [Elusimicrobiota bacterium]